MLDEYDRVCRPSALDETPCSVAEQRQHSGLNRYFNVLPFDFNRVRLQVVSEAVNPTTAFGNIVYAKGGRVLHRELSSRREAASQGCGTKVVTLEGGQLDCSGVWVQMSDVVHG